MQHYSNDENLHHILKKYSTQKIKGLQGKTATLSGQI